MSRTLFSAAVELLRVLFDYLFDYLYSHIYIIEFSSTDESVAGAASPLERLCPDKLHVRLGPLYRTAELTWQRLGVVYLHAGSKLGLAPLELRAAELSATNSMASGLCGKHSWPFPSDAHEPLLRAAEQLVARVVSEMPCVARDSAGGEFIAYQLAHRDTARPGNGAFGIVHADNVYAEDAIKDFAPELYSAMNCADRAAELKERIGVCSCRRDEVLLEVAHGQKRMIRGFNLWLLLEDDGRDVPLCFADLSSYRGQVTDCTCGTRTLKREAHANITYRAQADSMRPGDAYLFETWGPKAAYHAGVERAHKRRTGQRARRRSVEVRVALLV